MTGERRRPALGFWDGISAISLDPSAGLRAARERLWERDRIAEAWQAVGEALADAARVVGETLADD